MNHQQRKVHNLFNIYSLMMNLGQP